jgi:hypothetical protein
LRARKITIAACILASILAVAPAEPEIGPNGVTPDATAPAEERLVYKVEWDPPWYFFFLPKMDAGEVSLELTGETQYQGRKVSRIALQAFSSGTLAKMTGMKIEDEFVYHTEPGTYCTVSASHKIREGKRKRQIDVQYSRETRQLHILEIDESTVPPTIKKDQTKSNIPECVHDPLSALYMYRQLPLLDKYSRTFLLANDDNIREVRSFVERQEMIETASGKTAAWKIATGALMGGLFKEGGQFKIWFSADEKRVPLQFEVKVRLGRIFGKLKSSG